MLHDIDRAFDPRETLQRAANELEQAHSHRCPTCNHWWGCMSAACSAGTKLCFDHDPQIFDDQHGFHWRLRLELVESIVCIRSNALQVSFKNDKYQPVVSDPKQVSKVLDYLFAVRHDGDHKTRDHATNLWFELRASTIKERKNGVSL